MSWQKFTDRARESKKVRRSSPDAIVLWWAVGNYCCEQRSDGFIDKGDLPDAWRPIGRKFDHDRAAEECVRQGLFIDHGSAYEVHDFLEFNPSKEHEEGRKAKDARRQSAYRARQNALKNLAPVTRDATHDETRYEMRDATSDEQSDSRVASRERHGADVTRDPSDVRHAPPLRPASTRFEEEERERGARTSSHTQTFRDVFAAEAFAMEPPWEPSPELTNTHLRQAVGRTQKHAQARKLDFEVAAREMAKTALQEARGLGKDPGFVLLTCEPGKPRQVVSGRPANGNAVTGHVDIPLESQTSWK